jgi:hypothetical protein
LPQGNSVSGAVAANGGSASNAGQDLLGLMDMIYGRIDPKKSGDIGRVTKGLNPGFLLDDLIARANLGGLSKRSTKDYDTTVNALQSGGGSEDAINKWLTEQGY